MEHSVVCSGNDHLWSGLNVSEFAKTTKTIVCEKRRRGAEDDGIGMKEVSQLRFQICTGLAIYRISIYDDLVKSPNLSPWTRFRVS